MILPLKKYKTFIRLLSFLFCYLFFAFDSIQAQIGNIYDANQEDAAGINALMSAVVNNDVNGVRFFAKAGRALLNQKNFGGATALHLACREGNFEILKILLESGADANAIDNEGWTPLMRAALSGNNDSVWWLMKYSANAANINLVGESAIIHATIANCADCLNTMFEKFNFIKLMDIRLLKEQLTDAFIIARNHDNQVIQSLLESYLDQVIKSAPLIEKEKKTTNEETSEKTFKITADKEAVKTSKPLKKQIKEDQKTDHQPVQSVIHKHIYKFINNCDCEPLKILPQNKIDNNQTLKKESEKEVIFLIKKSETGSKTKSVNDDKFRFISGPKGKIMKLKIEPRLKKDDEIIKQVVADQKPQIARIESLITSSAAKKSAIKHQETIKKNEMPKENQDSQNVAPKFIIGKLPSDTKSKIENKATERQISEKPTEIEKTVIIDLTK